MKFLRKIEEVLKNSKSTEKNHPHDIELERQESESALAEIELRDR
jgi:hypothetical protein